MYVNENIENHGEIFLNQDSRLVFDLNLVNENIIHYQNGTNKGILQIGSGETTSDQPQSIQFNATTTEEAPFIILNKVSGTATINRGHLLLLETLVAESVTLDANSAISDIPSVNTVSGLTFSSNATNTAVVEQFF